MSRFEIVMATTHVDAHGERLSPESLPAVAADLQRRYLPLLREHDLLRPLGRISGATVNAREDGELELLAEAELIDGEEPAASESEREFHPTPPDADGLSLSVGREFHSSIESRAVLVELESFLGRPAGAEVRKSLEPADLIKIAGLYVLAKVAEGFLQQLGVDGYTTFKRLLTRLFETRLASQGRRLEIHLYFELERVEVFIIQTDPTPANIDSLLTTGLLELDNILPGLLTSIPNVRRVVAEYGKDGIRVAYVMGADCLPRAVKRPHSD